MEKNYKTVAFIATMDTSPIRYTVQFRDQNLSVHDVCTIYPDKEYVVFSIYEAALTVPEMEELAFLLGWIIECWKQETKLLNS